MASHFNDKGKIFTQIVSKESIRVIIRTTSQVIRGSMHVRRDSRIIDELNEAGQFIAVTGAVIYNLNNEEQHRCDFLTVNVSQIVWVIPENEVNQPST